MLNPVFKDIYCEQAVKGLEWLSAEMEKRDLNGTVWGHVQGS